jgi:hypothetical protein
MNYKIKAFRVFSVNGRTRLEDYEQSVPNYTEAEKVQKHLKSLGEYTNIKIYKNEKATN